MLRTTAIITDFCTSAIHLAFAINTRNWISVDNVALDVIIYIFARNLYKLFQMKIKLK